MRETPVDPPAEPVPPDVPGITPPVLGTPRRWGVFAVGVTCLITGIALSVTADLGVGSWQVLETGLVETTGLSYGVVVMAESLVAITLAWIWLGQRPWIATVLLAFGGVGIGALLAVISTPDAMAGRVALLTAGMVLLAIGVAFYLASDLGASAQDALFVGLYRKYLIRPGVVRFALDGSIVALGFLLGGQLGAGTVAVTIAVPALIEPALRAGHRLAATPLPAALRS
ncbi:MAG: YczE/YyaS/YitT family protein [Acidimicrobiales bacterium]